MSVELQQTDRTRLRRKRERGTFDRAVVDAILDEALLAHVGFSTEHGPVVLPMTFARMGDVLYLHGAAGNDMLRRLAKGTAVCVTVTLLDGLVLARSAFHHSMNYRSVVLFGVATSVTDPDELQDSMQALVDHVAPGRSAFVRGPSPDELRATLIIRLDIAEGSAKVRTGPPIEDPDDLELDFWGGVLPVRLIAGEPISDDQGVALDVPGHVTDHSLRT